MAGQRHGNTVAELTNRNCVIKVEKNGTIAFITKFIITGKLRPFLAQLVAQACKLLLSGQEILTGVQPPLPANHFASLNTGPPFNFATYTFKLRAFGSADRVRKSGIKD